MMKGDRCCVVIPLYNHAATVRKVAGAAIACGHCLIVVDDGSTDGGAETLAGLDLTLLRHEKNRGKGAALLTAAREAVRQGFDAMVSVDADGQLDPAEAGKLIAVADSSRPVMVIGARMMDAADNVPGSSRFGRRFSNFWVHLESGLTLPDTQSGMRLYPLAELLRLSIRSRGFAFEIEVISKMVWAGIGVKSVAVSVDYPPDRVSHCNKLGDNFRLSVCHTRLVARALCPWPHRRLVRGEGRGGDERVPVAVWLHPVGFFRRLCREHTSAGQLAAAAWLGVFLGALPILALHTVAIIYASHRLHLNKLAAVGASQLCMPPLVPVLCIEAGYFFRHGEFLLKFDWNTLVGQAHYRLWEWFLGSLLVGPLFGTVVAALFYAVLRSLRRGQVEVCG